MMKKNYTYYLLMISTLLLSCNKNSNELVPPKSSEKFDKVIYYNGNSFLTAKVEQIIKIGDDTLKITIANPYSDSLHNIILCAYFQNTDSFEDAFNYKSTVRIHELAAGEDTTFNIYNRPPLPVNQGQLFIKLLSAQNRISNPLAKVYDGNAGYYFDEDSVPSDYGFSKGIIEADGKCLFWLKLNNIEKKITGNLIDTLSFENGYLFQETHQYTVNLDTIRPNTHFIDQSSLISFRLLTGPPQNDLEKKIKITFYK